MVKAMNVADYIINYSGQTLHHPITNISLQKAMYFLNAQYLVSTGNPLIDDEKFEKWTYGPVIHSVYSEYSVNGSAPIEEPAKHVIGWKMINHEIKYEYAEETYNSELSDQVKKFIERNLSGIISKRPFELVRLSHQEDQFNDKTTKEYDNDRTISYYKKSENQFWN